MTKLLDDIFYDSFEVHNSGPTSPEYQACIKRLGKYYDRVREELGRPFFDDLYHAAMEVADQENRHFFRKGVQLGGQMALALMGVEWSYSSTMSAP